MALNPREITFARFDDMAAHLDRWAERDLDSLDAWAETLAVTGHWLDYSPRNQVLLASYGADGPVAGAETWRLVPSPAGRTCGVAPGEHGLPVRVPVTTNATEPDPYLDGQRPTRPAVQRWEWRPVFTMSQLVHRPHPDALAPPEIPEELTGAGAGDAYLRAVRKVAAASRLGGRPSRSDNAHQIMADAAGRLPRSKRPALDPLLRSQVAWLVADRVGLARGGLPPFDPSPLTGRERWEHLQDVLEPVRKLTTGLGVVTGVDLCASPLPRMDVIDGEVVPAGRRHRLPPAAVRQLPIGHWVTVGPYTPDEWTSRGEHGNGRGAYLRLDHSAYVVAIELGDSAGWRLEDVAVEAGRAPMASGTAASLDGAQRDALGAAQSHDPAVLPFPAAGAEAADRHPHPRQPGAALSRPAPDLLLDDLEGPSMSSAPVRATGDGHSYQPIDLDADPQPAQRPPGGGRALHVPTDLDAAVAELAAGDSYDREALAALVRARLLATDADQITEAEPSVLVTLLGAAGITPATTVAVLAAEQLDPTATARLLPTVGVAMADAIRVLSHRWGMPPIEASSSLDATVSEMRAAGCTPAEIMTVRPRDVMRALPDELHLWDLVAGTMVVAGYSPGRVAAHLIAHAPSPDSFANGLAAVTDDPCEAMLLAVAAQAPPEHVAAVSERYGLSPADTAWLLADSHAPAHVATRTVYIRCDNETEPTIALLNSMTGLDEKQIARHVDRTAALTAGVTTYEPSSPTALDSKPGGTLALQIADLAGVEP
jgi:hypothetical protein